MWLFWMMCEAWCRFAAALFDTPSCPLARRIALRAMAHLSDDETVAKMGHPNLDVGHPA
jgi:hypothetical protein